MLLLATNPLVSRLATGADSLLATAPQHFVYPLQTLVCGALLLFFWKRYELGPVLKMSLTLAVSFLIFVIWISPQTLFHFAERRTGFDPTVFQNQRPLFVAVLSLRFLRLVFVVPLLEEIFWRGFLLRDLIDRDFKKVPFGEFTLPSCALVTLLFGLAHWGSETWRPGFDFIPALCAGALFNFVAYRTRSLSSCVVAHAVTNLLLGIYIMQTRQWGFW